MADALYRLLDQADCVIWFLIDHTLEKKFLVRGFELWEVTFDAIELWAVQDIEDLSDV